MMDAAVEKTRIAGADRGRRRAVLMLGFPRLAGPFAERLADAELTFLYGRASALSVPYCDLV